MEASLGRRTIPIISLLACALAVAQSQGPVHRPGGVSNDATLRVEKADQLLDRSNFVFIGTVEQVATSNLTSIPAAPTTALVRVERVVHGTPLLAGFVGQVITVRSERGTRHQVGQASTYFLDVDTFGESISGLEMGRFPIQGDDHVRHQGLVTQAREVREDRALTQRMQRADQVVAGRVVAVEDAGIEEARSEHAAHWQRATIEVASVIKGQADTKFVTLFFPASDDRMWLNAPRFAIGDEGVWVLNKKPMDYSRKAGMIPGLTSLDAKDFHSADQSERLQRLMNAR